MANPFLVGDASATFAENNNAFNPFLTSASAELEPHNDNPFFSSIGESNSTQDNTNPFLAFTQKPEPPEPVADLLGIDEKPQTNVGEDASKTKPPPPRPAPPKRPPPRPTPPTQDAKELILSVTGEMDATSLHLLDRLAKTPSPTPIRDLLSPSPTPTADLLGYDDLQPPVSSQTPSVFDQQSNALDLPKPERPKFPPKIDYLMDDLLEDMPIDEAIHPEENFVPKSAPPVPGNPPQIGGSKPTSRKSSEDFIPPVRRLSHDVTESRKIMPDFSKIADRRKSDIGHFAPILPSRKPTSQSDQSLMENKTQDTIQEIRESDEPTAVEDPKNITESKAIPTEEIPEPKTPEAAIATTVENTTTWEEEKNGLDLDSQPHPESANQFEVDSSAFEAKLTPPALDSSPFEPAVNENPEFTVFDINATIRPSDSFQSSTNDAIMPKSIDTYDEKPIPPVPDPSPFQEIECQETSFSAVFPAPEKPFPSPFDVQEPQTSDNDNSVTIAEPEHFPLTASSAGDAFDAFAAKFDDSQNEGNAATGEAFDAFGGGASAESAFEDASMGFGADDNFDSFLSTHQIPSAPQSTPARVTRNNSGESVDENEFNVFIRCAI